jgi:hypothetical protein
MAKKEKEFKFRLTDEQKAKLEAEANRRNISMGIVLCMYIDSLPNPPSQ